MNAAETIQAAIDKLTARRDATTTSTWVIAPSTRPQRATLYTSTKSTIFDADAELIVTLHRTIGAQLAILQDAARAWSDPLPMPMFGGGDMRDGIYAYHLELARAILGEVPA